ncbi:hypothetical protein [Roseateles asaccharophilus]|uniref:HNH endonuclease n=1 Tax=Roseateles asaccharophilus TaxID=582607 RepID=A0ABU2AAS8_9BURK|nr:hypothetical protein [Roseateles asaccharophilus]MDR7334307.1 hypothetical protein [Roseateles asaccharophilus]
MSPSEEARKAERDAEKARKFAEQQRLADQLNSLLTRIGEPTVAVTIHPLWALFSESYPAYLQSPEWGEIRRRVLKRDGSLCRLCLAKAQCVHHISYDEPVIIGERDEDLISLCDACHASIEFDGTRQRSVEEKLIVLRERLGTR